MFDLVIIGGGPAGVAGAIYAERKKINYLMIADSIGGQSIVSAKIENWIGLPNISGADLAITLENHLELIGVNKSIGEKVLSIEKKNNFFQIQTDKGKKYESRYLLIATGSHPRKMNVKGEDDFEGRGIFHCATCDAPLLKNKTVAIIGGGNAGLEAAIDLLAYASKIYILEYTDSLKGDAVTQEKLNNNSKVQIITQAKVIEVLGDKFVSGLKYEDLKNKNVVKEIKVDGIFVAIGVVPSSDLVKNFVKLNERGEIIVDHQTYQSSDPAIFAAGDVCDSLYQQNNIAVGDAIKAVLSIYNRIK